MKRKKDMRICLSLMVSWKEDTRLLLFCQRAPCPQRSQGRTLCFQSRTPPVPAGLSPPSQDSGGTPGMCTRDKLMLPPPEHLSCSITGCLGLIRITHGHQPCHVASGLPHPLAVIPFSCPSPFLTPSAITPHLLKLFHCAPGAQVIHQESILYPHPLSQMFPSFFSPAV